MIAAVADVHCPRYLREFKIALEGCEEPVIFLLAGDMIEAGRLYEYRHVANTMAERFGEELPIFACFGNDEQGCDVEAIQETVGERIVFLNGETRVVPLQDITVGILGVPLLDAVGHKQNLEHILKTRIQTLAHQLMHIHQRCDRTILLMHYSPIATGISPDSFTWWIDDIFNHIAPDVIVHGHIHYSKNPVVQIRDTKVVNVAFPATRGITCIEL